jgi:hypothetical protein
MGSETRLIDVFKHPTARKMLNCVCYVMGDPLAIILRGACDPKTVIPAILRTPAVKRPRNGDIVIWWGDVNSKGSDGRGYHFARAFRGNYYMMEGIGGGLVWGKIKEVDKAYDSLYQYKKRVRRFKLPFTAVVNAHPRTRELYCRTLKERRWDIALKILLDFYDKKKGEGK